MQGRFYRSVNEEVPRRAFQNNSFGQESSDRGIKPSLRPWGNAETGSISRSFAIAIGIAIAIERLR